MPVVRNVDLWARVRELIAGGATHLATAHAVGRNIGTVASLVRQMRKEGVLPPARVNKLARVKRNNTAHPHIYP